MIEVSPANSHTIPPPTLQILSAVCRFGFAPDAEKDYAPRQGERITAPMTQLGAALARLRYQFPQRAADLAGVQEPQDTAGQNERRGMCDAALVRHA